MFRFQRPVLAACALACAGGATHAQSWHQMDTPEKVRTGLEAYAGKVHRFQPARTVRPLPVAPAAQAADAILSEGESFARGAYSALLIEDGKVVFEAYGQGAEPRLSLLELARRNGGTSRFKPGEKFIYNGLDSEALGIVVKETTGMSLPAWFEATVWQEAGGESAAAWFLDKDGNGIAEVLLFATSRDYARVALYVLERLTGQAGSDCIRRFIQEAAQPQVAKGYWASAPGWGFGLHTGADGQTWMLGAKGQRIGVNAGRKRVFVTNNNRDSPAIDSGSQALLNR